ncbi:hypothetical protein SDC9_187749 [bioreactor metagenome]|uniref:Uncharacterized protein n=1 Tax=bioreactor metagenome TaxID=1076179 RepID=A0A645HY27_9ZZZZ
MLCGHRLHRNVRNTRLGQHKHAVVPVTVDGLYPVIEHIRHGAETLHTVEFLGFVFVHAPQSLVATNPKHPVGLLKHAGDRRRW